MTFVLLIFYRINKSALQGLYSFFLSLLHLLEFVVPPITTLGACWNVPYFSFSPSLLPSLPLSFVRSFLFPMMTGAWGGHIPWIPLLSDTPLNYPPFNSSLNKNKWQVDLCVCVCTFASSLVFQIKDSALKATSSTLLTPHRKTSL